MKSKQ